jgi:hypothetical protein
MSGSNDFDRLVQEAESSLVERRRTLKAELDQAWEMDVGRSSEILNRMLGLTAKLQLLSQTRERFQALTRARQSVAEGLARVRELLEKIQSDCASLRTESGAVASGDLTRIRELLSEELGREFSTLELPAAPAEEVESLLRMLDRCAAGLEAPAGATPLDFGDRGIEIRTLESEELEVPVPEPGAGVAEEPAGRPAHTAAELEIAGLERELEGEDGILLADEVVDTEPPKPAPQPSSPEPSAKPEEDVVFVDERD